MQAKVILLRLTKNGALKLNASTIRKDARAATEDVTEEW